MWEIPMYGLEASQEKTSNLYNEDFYAWTQEQALLLQNHQWSQLDLANIIEEIESLGRQERRELINRLSILMGHLLKWQYQSQLRSRSWLTTIDLQRLEIADLLADNPSLKPELEAALERSYLKAVKLAVQETNLSQRTFPEDCPYPLAEMLDDRFYPGEPGDGSDEH
jgi:Domain of unknown function DUF29